MLLAIWANYINKNNLNDKSLQSRFIFAGLGKPTYPINSYTIQSFKSYWAKIETAAENWYRDPENSNENCAIEYGDPYGDMHAKTVMAKAMSSWYDSEIHPSNVFFVVGGIGGLRIVFDALNSFYAKEGKYRVITPFPHYSAYSNNPSHILHPIDVMSERGYQLTAQALEESIKNAYSQSCNDGILPKAILICNPSNPLGTIIKKEELQKIAVILRKHPELLIIFDEAYAEMNFIDMPYFLNVAPDLKKQTIILRSATKAFSAAGERMAVIIVFDDRFINELVHQKITAYIHAPRSSQISYAETMVNYSCQDRDKMASYYKEKVDYVTQRLKGMGAEMPCADYRVEGTFYALGDFRDLLGLELPDEAKHALEKSGKVTTGEDIAYYLLFKDNLMVAPLSYFGLHQDCGYLRITCSARKEELKEMMDRLENRLLQTRKHKKRFLV